MLKTFPVPKDSEYTWVGARNSFIGWQLFWCHDLFCPINHQDEIEVLGGWKNKNLSQWLFFQELAVFRKIDRITGEIQYYLGCTRARKTEWCTKEIVPSKEESFSVITGPTTRDELVSFLKNGKPEERGLTDLLTNEYLGY